MSDFTHLDESGDARMVDVAAKDITDRGQQRKHSFARARR